MNLRRMEEFLVPGLFRVGGYLVYLWSDENDEPIHVHISEGRPNPNATKVWLTSKGGCILANNNGKIPAKDLRDIQRVISAQFFVICEERKKHFKTDEIKFYC